MTQPSHVVIDRQAEEMQVTWHDGHESRYGLEWLRANCPCATCREERSSAAADPDPLRLIQGPRPSTLIADAEFVGNYAIRFTWQDGHAAGIYAFTSLRTSCPCLECNPEGPPGLTPD